MTKRRTTTKAKVTKKQRVARKATKAAKPADKGSFAALVREHVAARYPDYTFVATSGGSGPIVAFDRPTTYPKLREQIAFQKGLHGGTWFRVNLFPMFVGKGGGDKTVEHVLWEGETTGPDVRYEKAAELEPAIASACAIVEDKAAAFFAKFEAAYVKLDTLYGNLNAHFKTWLDETGHTLPAEQFGMDDDGKSAAFDSFFASLTAKKLLADLPGDVETPLWRYWNAGRPMREADYKKGDYYDCSKCASFVSLKSGKLVKVKDATIGTHYAFVCKKH